MGNLPFHIAQSTLYSLNKTIATGREATHRDDRVPFGVVIGDDKDFAIRLHAVCDTLDYLIGRLARPGKQNFNGGGRVAPGPRASMAGAIEHNSDRGSHRIAVETKNMHQFIARGGRMSRGARCELRPTVEQAVTVHEYPDQCHARTKHQMRRGNKPQRVVSLPREERRQSLT